MHTSIIRNSIIGKLSTDFSKTKMLLSRQYTIVHTSEKTHEEMHYRAWSINQSSNQNTFAYRPKSRTNPEKIGKYWGRNVSETFIKLDTNACIYLLV